MIFKKNIWNEDINESQLLKRQVNGFNDPCIMKYSPLLFSAFYKEEFKENEMKKEYIRSFIEAAKSLAKSESNQQPNMNGIFKIFHNYSLTLPTLYLCRHSIEIAIKYSLEAMKVEYKKIHKLKELWKKLLDSIPDELKNGEERTIIKNMSLFIDIMNNLDENGQKLRYAIQTNGKLSQDNFLWVYLQNIVESTENFVNQILNIDVDKILKEKKQ